MTVVIGRDSEALRLAGSRRGVAPVTNENSDIGLQEQQITHLQPVGDVHETPEGVVRQDQKLWQRKPKPFPLSGRSELINALEDLCPRGSRRCHPPVLNRDEQLEPSTLRYARCSRT